MKKIHENEMKFQALGMAKELHSQLAELTFLEMLAVISPDNPAKKEIQSLETKLNDLTSEIGDFIQKYIPDVADADPGDISDDENSDEEKEDDKDSESKDKKTPPKKEDKTDQKKEKKMRESFREFINSAPYKL